jgi:YVTN family beta-propeller protein
MAEVPLPPFSRRALLAGAAFSAACGPKKATAFPGIALVANREGHSVAALDLSRFRLARQIPVDGAPTSVIAHPKHVRAYVLAPDSGAIFELDGRDLVVRRKTRPGANALGMTLDPSGESLWVAYRDPAQLIEIPFETFAPRRRIALPAPPDDWDISGDGRAAVAFQGSRRIALASLTTSRVERIIETHAEPSIVRFQQDGRQLISGSRGDRTIAIYQVASGRTVSRMPIAVAPRHFCFSTDGGQLFITGDGMDGVVIVYPYDTDVAETVLGGHAPGAMAVTEVAPLYLLVANPESNSLTVLDIETHKLVAVVNVGQEPGHIVVTPDRQYALVLNRRSGDVAVIRVSKLAVGKYKSAPLFTMIPSGSGPAGAAVLRIV